MRPWHQPDHPAQRVCALCGQPIIKHIVPGDRNRHLAGKTGLLCPTDERLKQANTDPTDAGQEP